MEKLEKNQHLEMGRMRSFMQLLLNVYRNVIIYDYM